MAEELLSFTLVQCNITDIFGMWPGYTKRQAQRNEKRAVFFLRRCPVNNIICIGVSHATALRNDMTSTNERIKIMNEQAKKGRARVIEKFILLSNRMANEITYRN